MSVLKVDVEHFVRFYTIVFLSLKCYEKWDFHCAVADTMCVFLKKCSSACVACGR